ncbi:unnamed protein product [Cuscuta campestris]|uniref:Uncharacterized protein n=1 Tax=Cuscuta campestris TaxID=132261 RepID=A0A484K5T9_9ASTE|nr:unnamed protein product [Cuscuta campestris]
MAVLDLHHPWLFGFGILGNIISLLVFLAPMSTFIRIWRAKSTMGFHSFALALLAGFVSRFPLLFLLHRLVLRFKYSKQRVLSSCHSTCLSSSQ